MIIPEGSILYFTPFYFKNGQSAPKNKYFVILKNINERSIIASLPTRKDHIPSHLMVEYGCIECSEINLNCFVFSPDIKVTECGKKFDFVTHLYGAFIDDYEIDLLKDLYPNEGSNYVVWGQMRAELFSDLLRCFKNSKAVKRKYKKLL